MQKKSLMRSLNARARLTRRELCAIMSVRMETGCRRPVFLFSPNPHNTNNMISEACSCGRPECDGTKHSDAEYKEMWLRHVEEQRQNHELGLAVLIALVPALAMSVFNVMGLL